MHHSSFSVEASSLDCWQMSAWAALVVVLLCSALALVAGAAAPVPVMLSPSVDVVVVLAVISVAAVVVVAVVVVQLVPSCPRHHRHHQGTDWCSASLVVVVAVVLSLARRQTGSLLCQLAEQSCLPRSRRQTDLCSSSSPVLFPVLLLASLLELALVLPSLFVLVLEEVSAMVLEVAWGAGVVTSSLLMVCLLSFEG